MNEYIKVALEVSLSGLVAAIITFVLQRHYKKRDIKYQTISDFFEHRYHLKSDEFSSALNKGYLVFCKNKNVIKSIDDFFYALKNNESTDSCNNKLYQIYYYMCKSICLKPVDEKKFVDNVFNVK